MEKKNFIIEKIKKSDEEKMYVFYNITKNRGIKRMRAKNPSLIISTNDGKQIKNNFK